MQRPGYLDALQDTQSPCILARLYQKGAQGLAWHQLPPHSTLCHTGLAFRLGEKSQIHYCSCSSKSTAHSAHQHPRLLTKHGGSAVPTHPTASHVTLGICNCGHRGTERARSLPKVPHLLRQRLDSLPVGAAELILRRHLPVLLWIPTPRRWLGQERGPIPQMRAVRQRVKDHTAEQELGWKPVMWLAQAGGPSALPVQTAGPGRLPTFPWLGCSRLPWWIWTPAPFQDSDSAALHRASPGKHANSY